MTQTINIPLAGGLSEQLDPKVIEPPVFTTLVNAHLDKVGGIRKRYGSVDLGNVTMFNSVGTINAPITASLRLSARANELVSIDGHWLASNGPTMDKWAVKDTVPEANISTARVVRSSKSMARPDVGYANGFLCEAWDQGAGSIVTTVTDLATGTELFSRFELSTTGGTVIGPRVVGVGQYLFVLYFDGGTSLYFRRLDTAAPGAWGVETLISNVLAAGIYDACSYDATTWFLAFALAGSVYVAKMDTAGNVSANLNIFSVANGNMAICAAENVYVAYSTATPSWRCAVTDATATFSAIVGDVPLFAGAGNQRVSVGRYDATHAIVVMENRAGGATRPTLRTRTLSNGGIAGATTRTTFGFGVSGKVWNYNGRSYAIVVNDTTFTSTQRTQFMVDLDQTYSQLRPIGPLEPNTAGSSQSFVSSVVAAPALGAGVFVHAFSARSRVIVGTALTPTVIDGIDRAAIDLGGNTRWMSAQLGDTLYFSGASLSAYDGSQAPENGFFLYPEAVTTTVGGGGSGAMAAGNYLYKVTYEWTDTNGRVHRSAPSSSVAANAVPATGSVTVNIPHLWLTAKQRLGAYVPQTTTPVVISIYRTTVGSSTPYYLVSKLSTPPQNNPAAVADYAFLDTLADSSINANPTLYTSSGALESQLPPPSQAIAAHMNRIALACGDTVWFSTELAVDEAIRFHLGLTVQAVGPGNIVALASFEEKLIVFKSSSIFYVVGDGPNDAGQNGSWTITRLAADVGCVDPRSVVVTPLGVMFLSSKGLYILPPGLGAPTRFGAPISETLATYDEITSAVLLEDDRQIRFTFRQESNPSLGAVAVYDYENSVWSLSQYFGYTAASSACLSHSGRWSWCTAAGAFYQEDQSTFLDAGAYVQTVAETAPIKLSGVQGFTRLVRVTLLGQYLSAHQLELLIANDYEDFYSQSKVFGNATIAALPRYQLSAHVATQKAQSFRIRVQDSEDGALGDGSGFSLSGIALEIMAKRGSAAKLLNNSARK